MRRLLLFLLSLGLAVVALALVVDHNIAAPVMRQESLSQSRVYAYRDWQSVGVHLNEADRFEIRASGEWLYTPDEVHGPQGHARYPAPSFYPVPHVPGGALIGKIGEEGEPFLVGSRHMQYAYQGGRLYLRINDDRLGDNWGSVVVDVDVTPYEE